MSQADQTVGETSGPATGSTKVDPASAEQRQAVAPVVERDRELIAQAVHPGDRARFGVGRRRLSSTGRVCRFFATISRTWKPMTPT